MEKIVKCDRCGKSLTEELSSNEVRCSDCGSFIDRPLKSITRASEVSSNSAFCTACGKKVSGGAIKCSDCSPRASSTRTHSNRVSSGSDNAVNQVVPYTNPAALISYYLGVFSIIPCFALILGPAAVILSLWGFSKLRDNPGSGGKFHCYIGLLVGGLCFVVNLFFIILIMMG